EGEGGGGGEVGVGVGEGVERAQRGNGMKEDVLEIDRKVEKDDRANNRDPRREGNRIEKPPCVRLRDERETDRRGWNDEADQKRVHHDHAEIAGPAYEAADRLFAAWTDQLANRHRGQDAAECAQPDERLISDYGVAHEGNILP